MPKARDCLAAERGNTKGLRVTARDDCGGQQGDDDDECEMKPGREDAKLAEGEGQPAVEQRAGDNSCKCSFERIRRGTRIEGAHEQGARNGEQGYDDQEGEQGRHK